MKKYCVKLFSYHLGKKKKSRLGDADLQLVSSRYYIVSTYGDLVKSIVPANYNILLQSMPRNIG